MPNTNYGRLGAPSILEAICNILLDGAVIWLGWNYGACRLVPGLTPVPYWPCVCLYLGMMWTLNDVSLRLGLRTR